jgi:hypothetical protein
MRYVIPDCQFQLGFGREKFLFDIQGAIARESEIPQLRTVNLFRQIHEQVDVEEIKKNVKLCKLV